MKCFAVSVSKALAVESEQLAAAEPGFQLVLSSAEAQSRNMKATAHPNTGRKITWEQAMNSQENLSPDAYTWDAKPPKSEIAIPGVTPVA
jgi:hypothetical protein